MKRLILLSVFFISIIYTSFALSPYYKLAEEKENISVMENRINEVLQSANYEILGSYHVANNPNFKVIVFTNSTLKNIALSYSDRGALAAAQKVGLLYKDGTTIVSLLNPEYMFHAYFQKGFDNNAKALTAESEAIKKVFKSHGYSFNPFGGNEEIKDLQDYQYMIGMPDFTDPVELNSYTSFEEGLKIIRKNLAAKKGNTVKVYELVDNNKKVAVFGIGLLDPDKGEKHFLSIIGAEHLANMPYEIILQDKKVTMLHGRFRIALYWPDLTMGTFTKIMSSPGDIEDFMETICK